MFFWHDFGFQCARVSAQKNTMKFRKSTVSTEVSVARDDLSVCPPWGLCRGPCASYFYLGWVSPRGSFTGAIAKGNSLRGHFCACLSTANLRTKIMDFRGFDPSMILIFRGGIRRPIGNFLEILSQRLLVGINLVGRLGVRRAPALRELYESWGLGGTALAWGFGLGLGYMRNLFGWLEIRLAQICFISYIWIA